MSIAQGVEVGLWCRLLRTGDAGIVSRNKRNCQDGGVGDDGDESGTVDFSRELGVAGDELIVDHSTADEEADETKRNHEVVGSVHGVLLCLAASKAGSCRGSLSTIILYI